MPVGAALRASIYAAPGARTAAARDVGQAPPAPRLCLGRPQLKMRARMSNAAQATSGIAVRAWRAQQGFKAVRPAPLTPGLERYKRNPTAAWGPALWLNSKFSAV